MKELLDTEKKILNFLKSQNKPVAIIDIARGLRKSSSTISKYVAGLEAKGYVSIDESQPPRKLISLVVNR